MMRRASLVLLVGVVAACGPVFTPGRNLIRPMVEDLGCDYDAVLARSYVLTSEMGDHRRLTGDDSYTPEVGWDACEVLARVGGPTTWNYETADGQQQLLWHYGSDYSDKLLTLTPTGTAGDNRSRWVVAVVSW